MVAKRSKAPSYVARVGLIYETPEDKRTDNPPIDIAPLMDQLIEDRKRLGVIISDTIFDDSLKTILIMRFSRENKDVKKLFDPSIGGPLVSLTHKARLAYALGLIDKTALNDFEHIHKIRNKFAHSIKASFADTEVLKFVRRLSTAKGRKVTATNSHKFYKSANDKCTTYLKERWQHEIYRQAAMQG